MQKAKSRPIAVHKSFCTAKNGFAGPGHVTFWTLTTSDDLVEDLGERLRATEGRFMMTSVADVESVAVTGQTGKGMFINHVDTIKMQPKFI